MEHEPITTPNSPASVLAEVESLIRYCVARATLDQAKMYAAGKPFPAWVTYIQIAKHCPSGYREWLRQGLPYMVTAKKMGTVYKELVRQNCAELARYYLLDTHEGLAPVENSAFFKTLINERQYKSHNQCPEGYRAFTEVEGILAIPGGTRPKQKRIFKGGGGHLSSRLWGGSYYL